MTKEEAIELLKKGKMQQESREDFVKKHGFPAYTTEVEILTFVFNSLLKAEGYFRLDG